MADFKINQGDALVLIEIDNITKQETGRKISINVFYIIKTKDCTYWFQEDIDKYVFQVFPFDMKKQK